MNYRIYWSIVLFFFLSLSVVQAQSGFDYYLSNNGKDAYPGTSPFLAKKTFAATSQMLKNFSDSHHTVKVGLQMNDVFNERFITSYPIRVGTYSQDVNTTGFAVLNGTKTFTQGWSKEASSSNIYMQPVPYEGFSGYGVNDIGSYSYMYVFEIDKELEKVAPFTARKPLQLVRSLAEVEAIPGSCYTPANSDLNPLPVYIHTSDNSSPNANSKYRYEVAVRDFAVNSTFQENNVFENLWVRGYGGGIGMLPGGNNSTYNKIIFGPGAAIHHLVLRGGSINNSLFLPGSKNTNAFAVVFYDVEGFNRHCAIRNSIFLDIPTPIYAHTSYGTNFGAVELDNVVAFANKEEPGEFMFTRNNDTVLMNKVYTDGYKAGYNYGTAKYLSIKNSYFKDVTFGIGYSQVNPVHSIVENVFIKTTGKVYTTGIYKQVNTDLTIKNSIIHLFNNYINYFPDAGAFIYGDGFPLGKINATGNIFICDIYPDASMIAAPVNTDKGKATSGDVWNNNVYILLRGNKMLWSVTNPATYDGKEYIDNFDDWKAQSGQDKNSLFFDLRHDSRGLKAIFADPENGNYDLANTPEARQIAALEAGMSNPITCFIKKPGYEEAASLIQNNQVLSADKCRNPCSQNKLRIQSVFSATPGANTGALLTWSITEQQNIDHYELQKATGNDIFKKVANIAVSTDSSYQYIDQIQPGIDYQYRLAIFPKAGGVCFSEIQKLTTNDPKLFAVYPNPTSGILYLSMNGYVGEAKILVTDVKGQNVYAKEVVSLYN
ncbi:MAG: hypothetical protein ABIR19_03705, partial [Ginsengibacter sp.]